MSLIHLEKGNFNEIINKGLTLVDFYAEWCGPCKMIGPILEEISDEISEVNIVKVNIDEYSDIAKNYGVMSIPTLIMFKNGEAKDKSIGFMPKEDIIEFINKNK